MRIRRGDAVIAMRAGFSPDEIVSTGSNLDPQDMVNLFTHKVGVNLNSLSQLRNYGVLLRKFAGAADPSREALCPGRSRIHLEDQMPYSRMGVKVAELEEAHAIAGEQGLEIVGVHYYRGTGTVGTDHFLKPFPGLIQGSSALGDSLQYVDVGGGFGHQYHPQRADPVRPGSTSGRALPE